MAGRRAFLEQNALQTAAVIFQDVGRPQIAGDEDGVVGQFARTAAAFAGEVTPQPVVDVLQVVQPFAQVRIAGLTQAGAVFGTHALDRRLGRQARSHRFFQRPVPAAIVGEHAVGFEHVERGADQPVLAVHHVVDLQLKIGDGGGQPPLLGGAVVGQELFGRHRRLMQHDHAIGQALGEPDALHPLGLVRGDLERALGDQFAAGDHLGQDHGDDLEVLDLLLAIDALGAVLHHQHPDGAAAAQQRHAQEGVEGIFAGFWPVGEGRVAGRVRQIERPALADDLADQAFARLQPGDVHGARAQALRGEQLQVAGGPT